MSKARQLADLLDSNGDVVAGALDNAPDPDLTPYAELAGDAFTGNVLVGKTSVGTTTEGAEVRNIGLIAAARDLTGSSGSVLYLNRIGTTDGPIQTFYKDSTTVGSIGANGGRIQIDSGSNSAGVHFAGGALLPTYNQALDSADQIDLGNSTYRWQGLYLSGGVYLGGTGSANYLDDYEEGTFTPNVSDGGSGSMTASNKVGVYRKIGSLVYVSMYITGITKSGSGGLSVTGLPFTIAATNDACDYTGECRWDDINTDTQMLPYFESGTATIDFQQFNSTGYNGGVTINDCGSSFQLYNITGTYITSD